MKKIVSFIVATCCAAVLFSCKKDVKEEVQKQQEAVSVITEDGIRISTPTATQKAEAANADANELVTSVLGTESSMEARCSNPASATQATTLTAVTIPHGPGGTTVYATIGVSSTSQTGYLNIYVRKGGQIPSNPVYQIQHVSVPFGNSTLGYVFEIPATVGIPVDVAVQGVSECRTITKIFTVNYSANPCDPANYPHITNFTNFTSVLSATNANLVWNIDYNNPTPNGVLSITIIDVNGNQVLEESYSGLTIGAGFIGSNKIIARNLFPLQIISLRQGLSSCSQSLEYLTSAITVPAP